ALRLEALRLLHQLDAVDAELRDAGRLPLVGAPLDPDEAPVLLRDAAQQIRPIPAQCTGERRRRRLALLQGGESARIGEDRIDVLGDGERGAVAVGDLPPAWRPLDLAPRLPAGGPILSRARESSESRCGLSSCATCTSSRSCSRESLWCSAERRESR